LRAAALERLDTLERERQERSVAYEMLGPPRLTKMLYEAHLCGQLAPSVRVLAGLQPAALSERAHDLVRRDAGLRSRILSVGLPIITPDGGCVYRGATVIVPPADGDPLAAAARGWIDLRPAQFALWIRRANEMIAQADERHRAAPNASGSDVDWTAIDPDRPIDPAAFATWVFRFEDHGERIKR